MTALLPNLRAKVTEEASPCTHGDYLGVGWSGCVHGPDVARDQWGRPVVVFRGRLVAMTRASTLAKATDSGEGLIPWSMARALAGLLGDETQLAHARELVAGLPATEAELRALAVALKKAGGAEKPADDGTDQHTWLLHRVMTGEHHPDAPDHARRSGDALEKLLVDHGLVPVLSEQFGVCGGLQAAGSYDLLLADEWTGDHVIGDLKSSVTMSDRKYPWAVAIQCAVYARSQRYCPDAEVYLRDPEVNQQQAALLSVPFGTGEVHIDTLNIDTGYHGGTLSAAVREFRKRRPLSGGWKH